MNRWTHKLFVIEHIYTHIIRTIYKPTEWNENIKAFCKSISLYAVKHVSSGTARDQIIFPPKIGFRPTQVVFIVPQNNNIYLKEKMHYNRLHLLSTDTLFYKLFFYLKNTIINKQKNAIYIYICIYIYSECNSLFLLI